MYDIKHSVEELREKPVWSPADGGGQGRRSAGLGPAHCLPGSSHETAPGHPHGNDTTPGGIGVIMVHNHHQRVHYNIIIHIYLTTCEYNINNIGS